MDLDEIGPGSVMNATAGHRRRTQGHSSGNSSPTRAMSFVQAIGEVSCEQGFDVVSQQTPVP
jgi:hypothetical protein